MRVAPLYEPFDHPWNPNRVVHLEEILGRLVEKKNLEDQFARDFNGHKVPLHVGMGQGEGLTRRQLFHEPGNDTSLTAEHVAESDRRGLHRRPSRVGGTPRVAS